MKINKNTNKFKHHSLIHIGRKYIQYRATRTFKRVQNFDIETFDYVPKPTRGEIIGKYKHPPQFPLEDEPHELLTSSQWCFTQLHLNRPEFGNTLNLSLVDKLQRALKLKEEGNVTKLLLLKGRFNKNSEDILLPSAYDKAFCTGPDWGEILENKSKGRMDLVHKFFRDQYNLCMKTYNFQKPLMALLNGSLASSGAGLAFNCGLRLSTATTLFAMPETGFGFIPDCGQTFQLSRLEKNLGTYLALTGRRVVGFDLKHLGLATHHIIVGTENKMGHTVGNAWTSDYTKVLRLMEVFEDHGAPFSLGEFVDIIDNCFGKDTVEEIIDSLKTYYSSFATKTLQTLQEKSPLALKLTLEAFRIRNREDLDLRQSMHNEWRVVKRLLDDPKSDLYIGLDSTVISGRSYPKFTPKWNHASLRDVPDSLVKSYFEPFQREEDDDFVHEIEDRPLGELDQIVAYLSHHRQLLSEHKMPEYLEDVQLSSESLQKIDQVTLEDTKDQEKYTYKGESEMFYNAVMSGYNFEDALWDEGEGTITFECPVEFDFDRQSDRQTLENIFLSVKAESVITGSPMPDLKEFEIARSQIEETYTNMYLMEDLSDFFEKWSSAEYDMEEERFENKDYSKFVDYKCYIHAPQLFMQPHIEGEYWLEDEIGYPKKKYY